MATKKGGSLKKTDTLLLTSVALSTEVTGTLGVANGGTGQTTYTNGQLLIGNTTGNTLAKATLTQGTGISITNGAGSITIGVDGTVLTTSSSIAVSQLAALNGFTDTTPALDDVIPLYDTSASGNRDAKVQEIVGAGVEGFILGCKLEYLTTTSIRVTPGLAQIQSSGKILKLSSNSDTSPSLSASTWYHVYLYDNSGTVATEVSTTAPASAWVGTAKSKTSDTTRRYLGSFRTNSSSQIYNFAFIGAGSLVNVTWKLVVSSEMRALAAGTATSNTTVDLSNFVPPGTRHVKIRLFSNANAGLRTDDDTMTGTNPQGPGGPGSNTGIGYAAISTAGGDLYPEHPCNASQQIRYAFITTPTSGGAYFDVYGYWLER